MPLQANKIRNVGKVSQVYPIKFGSVSTYRKAFVVLVVWGHIWILPGKVLWAGAEKTSGDPNEDVVLDWFNTELKSTGSVFHP